MMIDRRKAIKALAAPLLAPAALASAPSKANDYPNKPIRIIVGFPAGGPYDGVPRVVAQQLGERLGWKFVIENRVGADGQLGVIAAKQSSPDGYTLGVITSITHGSAPALKKNLGYDAYKDLTPIILLGDATLVLLVRSEVPAHSVAEFIDLLKKRPGELNYSTGGPSSQHFLATSLLFQRAGLPPNIAVHVPFPGIAPAFTGLLTGTTQFMIASTGAAAPHMAAGTLRALATTNLKRSPRLPDVPTLAESGFPGYQVLSWVGLAAPAETPEPIIRRWNEATNEALKIEALRQQIANQDYEVRGGTPADFAAFYAADIAQYRKLVEEINLPRI